MVQDQYTKRLRLLSITHTLKSKPQVIMLKHGAFGRHLGHKRKQVIKIRADIENRKSSKIMNKAKIQSFQD